MAKCLLWTLVVGTIVACAPALDWWQSDIVYQIYPLSFKDSNGDGFGDINGITEKLEYLAQLGVGAVCLCSILKAARVDMRSEVTSFTEIDPILGTMDDFDQMMNKSRELGLKVILEFVPNHSSDMHPWFNKSVNREWPYTRYYVWANGVLGREKRAAFNGTSPTGTTVKNDSQYLPPNNWLSKTGSSAWEWNEQRQQFYLHQTTASCPDLNYRSSALIAEMQDVLTFWLERGVHGFRLDGLPLLLEDEGLYDEPPETEPWAHKSPFNLTGYWSLRHIYTKDQDETYDMVRQWRQQLDHYSNTDGVTRVLMAEGDTMDYYGDSVMPGAHLLINYNLANNPRSSDAVYTDLTMRRWLDSMPDMNWAIWMIGSPNMLRVPTRFSPSLVDAMNTMVLLLPGTALTYYGEEIGMEDTPISWAQTQDLAGLKVGPNNYQLFSNDPARTPFPWNRSTSAGFSRNRTTWLPVNRNYNKLNQLSQSEMRHSHYQVYVALAKARKWDVVRNGEFNPHIFSDSVLGFSRSLNGKKSIFAVFNFGNETETVDLLAMDGVQVEMCVYTSSVNNDFFEQGRVISSSLTLPSSSCVVLTKCLDSGASALLPAAATVALLLLWSVGGLAFRAMD